MATNGGFGNVNIPEGFSEGELKRSYWWVTHREQVRKAGIGALIGVDVILMLIGIWGFVDFLAFGGVKEEQAARQLTGTFPVGSAAPAEEIKVSSPIVIPSSAGRYDLILPVENPNGDAVVELTYNFSIGGALTPERKGFILPGQSKNLYELGYKVEGSPGSVQPFILTRSFRRIDRRQIPDFEAWAAPRLDIAINDARFFAPDAEATVQVSRTTFTLENHTSFSYYDADFYVLLYRADALVGVSKVRQALFRSAQSYPQELFWYQNLPQVTRVDVIPDINILDPKVYQVPGA